MNRVSTEGYKSKFGYVCMVCLEPGGEVHHITPLAAGGKDDETNWINLCYDCHRSEHKGWRSRKLFLRTHKFYFEAKFLAEGPFWEGLPRTSKPQTKQIKGPHPKVPKFILDRSEEKMDARIQAGPFHPETEQLRGVTPVLCPCGCGQIVPPGRKWAERGHRDRVRNKARLRANKLLWEILLREADLRGYEVKKKPTGAGG